MAPQVLINQYVREVALVANSTKSQKAGLPELQVGPGFFIYFNLFSVFFLFLMFTFPGCGRPHPPPSGLCGAQTRFSASSARRAPTRPSLTTLRHQAYAAVFSSCGARKKRGF